MARSQRHSENVPQHIGGDFLPQKTNRRGFLQRLGRGAVVGLSVLEADTLVGKFIWGGTNPEMHMLPDRETEKRLPRHAAVVLGGFGVSNVLGLAESVRPSLRRFGQVAYMQNSNSGLVMDDQKRALRHFVKERGIQSTLFYGHSMAGMEALELADDLRSQGVTVNGIFYDCTPKGWSDVRPASRRGAAVLATARHFGVTGGPILRWGIEFAERALVEHRDDYWKMCREALAKDAPGSSSDGLIEAQADYLYQFRAEDFSFHFTDRTGTQMIKLGPENPTMDSTINNISADMHWQHSAFPHLSMMFPKIPGGGHADPGSHPHEYNRMILAAGLESGFYDGTPATTHSYYINNRPS